MKRILFLVLGYFLVIQAGIGALLGIGNPENLVAIWIVCGFAGCLGYLWVKKAGKLKTQAVLETQKLPEEPVDARTTAGLKVKQ